MDLQDPGNLLTRPSPILSLPPELERMIAEEVPRLELFNLRLVSTRMAVAAAVSISPLACPMNSVSGFIERATGIEVT